MLVSIKSVLQSSEHDVLDNSVILATSCDSVASSTVTSTKQHQQQQKKKKKRKKRRIKKYKDKTLRIIQNDKTTSYNLLDEVFTL